MGDRCYMEITCRKADVATFEEAGFVDASTHYQDHDPVTATMVEEERNYGDTDDLPKDVPFVGSHGEGCNYGPGVFACDGQRFEYHETMHDSAYPAVKVAPDGTVDPEDLREASRYWEIERAACRALGIKCHAEVEDAARGDQSHTSA